MVPYNDLHLNNAPEFALKYLKSGKLSQIMDSRILRTYLWNINGAWWMLVHYRKLCWNPGNSSKRVSKIQKVIWQHDVPQFTHPSFTEGQRLLQSQYSTLPGSAWGCLEFIDFHTLFGKEIIQLASGWQCDFQNRVYIYIYICFFVWPFFSPGSWVENRWFQ